MSNTVRNAKQKYKGSIFKRLIRESLILSYLHKLSDRIVKLLSSGMLYLIFCGSDETDDLVKHGFFGRILSNINLGNRIIRPFKVFFADGIEKSRIVALYRHFIKVLLSISIRFFGILSCTFGVYGIAVYLAKMFSYLTIAPNDSELFCSVFLIIAGSPMLLSGRSVASVLKTSRFFGWLFIDILGINEMTLREQKKPVQVVSGALAFVTGTILGLTTIFVNPTVIVLSFIIAVLFASVIFTPELGLLSSILLFPLASVKLLAITLIITSISYSLKVLRAKRNLRFKTADIFVLFFALYIIAVGVISGSGGQVRALYLLCFLAAYFLITNLIVSEKLINQTLYSLCTGSAVGCLLFLLQHIAGNTDNMYINPLLNAVGSSIIGRESFGYFLVMLLPVCMALFKVNNCRSQKAGLLVLTAITIACIIIKADSEILSAAYLAIIIYSLFAFKNAIFTLLIYITTTLVLFFAIPFIPFLNSIYSASTVNLMSSGIGKLIFAFLFNGVGMGDYAMIAGLNKVGASNYLGSLSLFERLLAEGGIFFFAVFLLAVFFILQRAFYCISRCININIGFVSSAFAAVILMFLSLGLFRDMWADIRIYMLFWIICGMVSAIKNVHGRYVFVREVKDNE